MLRRSVILPSIKQDQTLQAGKRKDADIMSTELSLYSTSYLSKETLDLLFGGCQEKSYAKGETVFSAGDPSDSIYLIIRGRLMTYKFSDDGKQQFDSLYRDNSTVGFRDAFSTKRHSLSCSAVDETTLLICPKDLFVERAYEHHLWVEILEGETKKQRFGIRRLKPFSKEELFRCIRIMEREGLTQAEIGMILGYSRVHITRLVNEMYRKGDS